MTVVVKWTAHILFIFRDFIFFKSDSCHKFLFSLVCDILSPVNLKANNERGSGTQLMFIKND